MGFSVNPVNPYSLVFQHFSSHVLLLTSLLTRQAGLVLFVYTRPLSLSGSHSFCSATRFNHGNLLPVIAILHLQSRLTLSLIEH